MSKTKHIFVQSFDSSSAKDYIRSRIDYDIIKKFKQLYYPEQKLGYLGLSGAQLLDILNWREFINYCTIVENTSAADELERNVLRNHLEHIVHLVRSNIDDVIYSDSYTAKLRWPYQIINLDYCGGLIYTRQDRTSRHLESLKKLFERQTGTAFVLFLTLNLRDKDLGELDNLVKMQEDELQGLDLEGIQECFDKHRELNHAGLLKLYVPIFLDSFARKHTLIFISPILYQGTQQMIHFAVQCLPYKDLVAGRLSIIKERINLINLPLLTLHSHGSLQSIELGRITWKNS